MNEFDHERLGVYHKALDFVIHASQLIPQLPRGRGHLGDQLERAATSVPLNIAEGAGEYVRREKARFYRMARRSATESAAILEICHRLRLIDEPCYQAGRGILLEVVAMLVKLIRNLGEDGRREEGQGQGQGRGQGEDEGQGQGQGQGQG